MPGRGRAVRYSGAARGSGTGSRRGPGRLDHVLRSRFRNPDRISGGIFSKDEGASEKGIGRRFTSADGRSTFIIYSRANDTRDTPASYLRKNLKVSRSTLDYERIAPSFFAISSVRQGSIFYSRCNFSSDAGGAIHCFDMVYPQEAKRAFDYVVTRISRSLRPLETRGTAPGS